MISHIAKKRKLEYFDVLGVPPSADDQQVKQAYHKLALELHPDRTANRGHEVEAAKKFQEVCEAYTVLHEDSLAKEKFKMKIKSPELQNAVEQLFKSAMSSAQSDIISPPLNPGVEIHVNNIPSSLSIGKKSPMRGHNLKAVLHLSEDESTNGCKKVINYTKTLNCDICTGSGHGPNSAFSSCPSCDGKGTKVTVFKMFAGSITTACRECHSTGLIKARDCKDCSGTGKKTSERSREIVVPPKSSTGVHQVFDGEGDDGSDGGISGDLVVCFEVEGTDFVDPIPTYVPRKRGRKPGFKMNKKSNPNPKFDTPVTTPVK